MLPKELIQSHPSSRPIFSKRPAICEYSTNPSCHFHFFVVVRLRIERLRLVAVHTGLSSRAAKAESGPTESTNVLEFLPYRYVLIYIVYTAEIEF